MHAAYGNAAMAHAAKAGEISTTPKLLASANPPAASPTEARTTEHVEQGSATTVRTAPPVGQGSPGKPPDLAGPQPPAARTSDEHSGARTRGGRPATSKHPRAQVS